MTPSELDRVIDLLETAADLIVTGVTWWRCAIPAAAERLESSTSVMSAAHDAEFLIGFGHNDESRIESLLKTAAALRKVRER